MNETFLQDLRNCIQLLISASKSKRFTGSAGLVPKVRFFIKMFDLPEFSDTMLRLPHFKVGDDAYGAMKEGYEDVVNQVEEMLGKSNSIDPDTLKRIRLLMSYIDVLYAEFKREQSNPTGSDIQLRREIKGLVEATPISFSMKQKMMRIVYKTKIELSDINDLKTSAESYGIGVRGLVGKNLKKMPVDPEVQEQIVEWVGRLEQFLEKNDYQNALICAQQALQVDQTILIHPDKTEFFQEELDTIFACYELVANLGDAIEIFEAAINIAPNNHFTQSIFAKVLKSSGQDARAFIHEDEAGKILFRLKEDVLFDAIKDE